MPETVLISWDDPVTSIEDYAIDHLDGLLRIAKEDSVGEFNLHIKNVVAGSGTSYLMPAGSFAKVQTPEDAEFATILATDQAGPRVYGSGDTLYYINTIGYEFSVEIKTSAATSLLIIDSMEEVRPVDKRYASVPVNMSEFREGYDVWVDGIQHIMSAAGFWVEQGS